MGSQQGAASMRYGLRVLLFQDSLWAKNHEICLDGHSRIPKIPLELGQDLMAARDGRKWNAPRQ